MNVTFMVFPYWFYIIKWSDGIVVDRTYDQDLRHFLEQAVDLSVKKRSCNITLMLWYDVLCVLPSLSQYIIYVIEWTCVSPFLISSQPHERWCISYDRNMTACWTNLFRLTTKEAAQFLNSGALWGKSTGGMWIPLHSGQNTKSMYLM